MTGFSVWATLGKAACQSCRGFFLGETSWFAPEQRQEGAHMHAVETAGEQSPGGNTGSQIGCADRRCFHIPVLDERCHFSAPKTCRIGTVGPCCLLASSQASVLRCLWHVAVSRLELLQLWSIPQVRMISVPWIYNILATFKS